MLKLLRRGSSKKSTQTTRLLLGFVVAAVIYIAYSYLGGSYGFYSYWMLHRQKKALEAELTELQLRQDSLKLEIKRLQSDTTYIEELARKKYYMGRADEQIYVVARKEKP